MTATEELRALLDGRGVEYEAEDRPTNAQTYWGDWCFMEPLDAKPRTLGAQCELMLIPATPQQAVDATLGRGECEPKWVLQGETQTQEFWRCECGNCGECFGVEDRESFPLKITLDKVKLPNYCPNCGKAVKR